MSIYQNPYCTYLTVIIHEDLPFMYIGSGKTKDVLSGKYKGSVSSKEYKNIFNKINQEYPHLIHSEVINQFATHEEAYSEEIKLHAKYDVARCPVFMNKARATTTGFSRFGVKHSDESKAKLSEANKGENNPRFGVIPSEETRAKLSAANKGEKNPMFGVIPSEETRAKLSAALKGTKRKPRTDETKQKISARLKGQKISDEQKAKVSAFHKGKKRTEETRAKLSLAKKGKPQPIITCPHCGKSGGTNVMTRWHFDNCKNLIKEN
jgi:hypothetical protein